MEASIAKVKSSLPEDKHDKFEEAIQIVAFSNIDFSSLFQDAKIGTGSAERIMKETLDGKTADGVFALAEKISLEQEVERLEQEVKRLKREGERLEQNKILEAKKLKRNEINKILSEARELERDDDLISALNRYQDVLGLDGDSEAALSGIKKTTKLINEFKQEREYLNKVNLYDFEVSTIDTYSDKNIPAVKFKIKNAGDKTLTNVEVTVYLKDRDGNIIMEEDFNPVLVSAYSFSGNNKPLKPGYIWEMEKGKWYTIKNAPSEWHVGNAVAKITDIEIEN